MADRFSIFVDAGFLYAAGGLLCLGTKDRSRFNVDVAALAPALARICAEAVSSSHLRTYWYDAAPAASPTVHHEDIARLRRLKVRLGRLLPEGQKGVDSLIVRDLVILANRRAIDTAFLLAGDEDLTEGVREAQDHGVEVILVSVKTAQGLAPNLSEALLMEADDLLSLSKEFLEPHFQFKGLDLPVLTAAQPGDLGRQFAALVGADQGSNGVRQLLDQEPRIPSHLDGRLLAQASSALGRFDLEESERRELRRGFWEGLAEWEAAQPKSD